MSVIEIGHMSLDKFIAENEIGLWKTENFGPWSAIIENNEFFNRPHIAEQLYCMNKVEKISVYQINFKFHEACYQYEEIEIDLGDLISEK